MRLVGKPSGASDSYYMIAQDAAAGTSSYSLALRATSGYIQEASGIVHCDANGRFYLIVAGTWSSVNVQLIGYFI